eukprot:365720-Chlamydomonas_euryale.AAC.16
MNRLSPASPTRPGPLALTSCVFAGQGLGQLCRRPGLPGGVARVQGCCQGQDSRAAEAAVRRRCVH